MRVEFEHSVLETKGRLARLTFRRPERLNAFHYPAVRDLDAAGRMLLADGEVRVVALQGEGRAFSTGIDLKDLRSLADEGKKQVGSGVVAIVATAEDGKAGIVVGVTDDLTKRFNAVDLVKKGAEALGGKGGGGRPDMAQAGGPDGSKADAALKAIEAALGG